LRDLIVFLKNCQFGCRKKASYKNFIEWNGFHNRNIKKSKIVAKFHLGLFFKGYLKRGIEEPTYGLGQDRAFL
jgi:hypothetical protein